MSLKYFLDLSVADFFVAVFIFFFVQSHNVSVYIILKNTDEGLY